MSIPWEKCYLRLAPHSNGKWLDLISGQIIEQATPALQAQLDKGPNGIPSLSHDGTKYTTFVPTAEQDFSTGDRFVVVAIKFWF